MSQSIIHIPLLEKNNIDFLESTESFDTIFQNSQNLHKNVTNSIVEGVIVNIDKEFVTVDVGLKAEGLIDVREFKNDKGQISAKIGDVIRVFVEAPEGIGGRAILSYKQVKKEEMWYKLQEAFDNDEVITGYINARVKGGFAVVIGKCIVGFLPGSQVDVRPIEDIHTITDVEQEFKILKMDNVRGNVVVSRRAVFEQQYNDEVDAMLSTIQEGMILEGKIKNITSYGAFADLGRIDGLIHITDMSWERITHPSEKLKLGQVVKVKVIKYVPEKKQVSLGMKQLDQNPWIENVQDYKVDSKHKGKISNITDYGIFVNIAPGIEGLVHISEIKWEKAPIILNKMFKIGEEVEVKIMNIDEKKHRVGLSMKRCQENPWEIFASKHKIGDVIEGKVRGIIDFGIFVRLEGSIDGLVHISDLSWTGNPKDKLKNYNSGDTIKAKVINIITEESRISLGIKQLEENPLTQIQQKIAVGETITCIVSALKYDSIIVSVENKITVLIRKHELALEKSEQKVSKFAIGEKVDAQIIDVDEENARIELSIRLTEMANKNKVIEAYGSTVSGASLGDILGTTVQVENTMDDRNNTKQNNSENKKINDDKIKDKPNPDKTSTDDIENN